MSDSSQFNVRDRTGRLLCPACGYPDYYACVPAYDARGGLIGSAICPCCLWEPGFDDDPAAAAKAEDGIVASLQAYRAAWGSALRWRGRMAEKPPGWDGEQQLAHLFELAPGIR